MCYVTHYTCYITRYRCYITRYMCCKVRHFCFESAASTRCMCCVVSHVLYQSVQFSISEQLLHINVQRFRGGIVFKAHRLCVSLNSWLESNKEKEEKHLLHSAGEVSQKRLAVLRTIGKYRIALQPKSILLGGAVYPRRERNIY